MVLSKEQLTESVTVETFGEEITTPYSPFVSDIPDPDNALQPNGIDLSVASIATFTSQGMLGRNLNLKANTAAKQPVNGSYLLPRGCYLVTFNETVHLPNDVMAYLRPRSSLLRMGAGLETAVWDAGYVGKGQSLLVVSNPYGIEIGEKARIGQLVLHRLEQQAQQGYQGQYQEGGFHDTNFVAPLRYLTGTDPMTYDPTSIRSYNLLCSAEDLAPESIPASVFQLRSGEDDE